MMHFSHCHRPVTRLWSEARLCFNGNGGGNLSSGAENIVLTSSEFVRRYIGYTGDVTTGIYRGLMASWGTNVTPVRQEALRSTVNFLRTAPRSVAQLVENHIITNNITNENVIKNLTDQTKWLTALRGGRTNDLFTFPLPGPLQKTNNDLLATGEPLALMRNQPLADRQRILLEYLDLNIPREVQEANDARRLMFGRQAGITNATDRFNHINTNAASYLAVTQSLDGMLGAGVPPAGASRDVVIDSFNQLYPPVDAVAGNRRVSSELVREYQQALRLLPTGINADTLNSGAALGAQMGPSRLRGLLMLGNAGVSDAVHQSLTKDAQAQLRLRETLGAQVGQSWNTRTRASQNERVRDSMTGSDIWQNMNGWQKLIALVTGILTARSHPEIVQAGVGVYFARMFLARDMTPGDTGLSMLRGAVDWVRGSPAGAGRLNMHQQAIARGNMMVQFLPEAERGRLILQAEGFAHIAHLPLSALANAFTLSSGPTAYGALGIEEGTPLRRDLRTSLQNHVPPLSTQSLTFFDVAANRAEVSDAVAYLFYHLASEKPENRARVELVRRGLGTTSVDQGFRGLTGTARTAFQELVEDGRGEAMGMEQDRTLLTYVSNATGVRGAPVSGATINKINNELVQGRIKGLTDLAPSLGAGAQFQTETEASTGKTFFVLHVGGPAVPNMRIDFTRDQLMGATEPAALFVQWKERAIAAKLTVLNGSLPEPRDTFFARRSTTPTERVEFRRTNRGGPPAAPETVAESPFVRADILRFLIAGEVAIRDVYVKWRGLAPGARPAELAL